MIKEAVEDQVVMESAFIVVVNIAEDVDVARDIFWIVDEGDCRVLEDKFIVVEDVADHTDQFAAFREKRRIKLFVDRNEPKQLGQLLPLAEQVKASEARQLAVIEVDDLTGKLWLHSLHNELAVLEFVGEQSDLLFGTAEDYILKQFFRNNYFLG